MFYKKHKIINKKLLFVAVPIGLAIVIAFLMQPAPVHAAIPVDCPDGYQTTVVSADQVEAACADHQAGTHGADSTEADKRASFDIDCTGGAEGDCGIMNKMVDIINLVSGLVGVVVVIMIIVGGIQYSSAGSDPQKIASAKSKIVNALLALLVFLFLWAFLQWIVPGGVFR